MFGVVPRLTTSSVIDGSMGPVIVKGLFIVLSVLECLRAFEGGEGYGVGGGGVGQTINIKVHMYTDEVKYKRLVVILWKI